MTEAKMGFDLKEYTKKLAMEFTKQGQASMGAPEAGWSNYEPPMPAESAIVGAARNQGTVRALSQAKNEGDLALALQYVEGLTEDQAKAQAHDVFSQRAGSAATERANEEMARREAQKINDPIAYARARAAEVAGPAPGGAPMIDYAGDTGTPQVYTPAPAPTETEASPVEAPPAVATPPKAEEPPEKPIPQIGDEIPYRDLQPWQPVTTMPGNLLGVPPLPSQGGGLIGTIPRAELPAPGPKADLLPSAKQTSDREDIERELRSIREEVGSPKTTTPGAATMGEWMNPLGGTPAAVPVPKGIGPYAAPGAMMVTGEVLEPVLMSIGIFQRGMDKHAGDLAHSSFQAMMGDMASWASGEGVSMMEKIGSDAVAWFAEGEDREPASKMAQADALGRIMAASHLSWLLKVAGGGAELSVEEQRQGRSYNNPTGEHPIRSGAYDALAGKARDDSTLELPVGDHKPDAR